MLALRCPFRINNSMQRSENIKGEQEMPSIKLYGNVLNKNKFEFMMVQEIQTVQGHHEERLEEMRDM